MSGSLEIKERKRWFMMDHDGYGGTGNYERTESHFERVVMVIYDFCKVFNERILP